MRISVIIACLFPIVAIASDQMPMAIDGRKLEMLFRKHQSAETVERELRARYFAGAIDAETEKTLLESGMPTALLEAIKRGDFAVPLENRAKAEAEARKRAETRKKMRAVATMLAPRIPPPVPVSPAWKQRAFATEENWVADLIVREMAEMICFAKSKDEARALDLKVTLKETPSATRTVIASINTAGSREQISWELQHHIWAAEDYFSWADTLLKIWTPKIPAQNSAPDSALAQDLTPADFGTLIEQGQALSEQLTAHPLDAEIHRRAAFVLGVLAFQESAGEFSDVRRTLCRMTAHLAIAHVLQPNETNESRMARIIILALADRQSEALREIAQLDEKNARWAMALQLRVTGDWRLLSDANKASRLEQLEYYRALKRSGCNSKARAFFASLRRESDAAWDRATAEGSRSIEEGHLFDGNSLFDEMDALTSAWLSFSGSNLREAEIVELLNRPAQRSLVTSIPGEPHLEVLSWGDIAAFYQRHICYSVVRTEEFLRESWGVPEQAAKFEAETKENLSGLTLYPIVRRKLGPKKERDVLPLNDLENLCEQQPQLVPAAAWRLLGLGNDWFHPASPFGTQYDLSRRAETPGLSNYIIGDAGHWDKWATIAPYDYQTLWALCITRHAFAGEQFGEITATIKDFNARVMMELARLSEKQPAAYAQVMESLCKLEPDSYVSLGDYFVKNKMPEDAARAYQNAFDYSDNRVLVANDSDWLVQYYFDHDRLSEAETIARDAAATYSKGGLHAMARLRERMDRLEEAEDYYKKIQERYNDTVILRTFYFRYRDHSSAFAEAAEKLQAALFPTGLEKADANDFSGMPHDGVMIKTSNPQVQQFNLKVGDVIVGIEGTRVHSTEQYTFLRDQNPDSPMTLLVWNGSGCRSVEVNLPKRRMNCEIGTFASN